MNYQKIAEEMSNFLRKNKDNWQERFGGYIESISQHREYISNVESNIRCHFPLKVYLPLSSATTIRDDDYIKFQIRYKGNLVGELSANKNKSIFTITDNHAEYSNFKFKDEEKYKTLNKKDWDDCLQRELLSCLEENTETSPEHQFESYLLNDFAQINSRDKIIPYITPVTWGRRDGSCFQMPTTWRGSLLSTTNYNENEICSNLEEFWACNAGGGGIDILARRMYGSQVRLDIMELKSPEGEFAADRVILQALAYTVFVRELLRSEKTQKEKWWKMFISDGKTSLENPLKLEAVVVLSKPDKELSKPNFANKVIKLCADEIGLHYLYLTRNGSYSWELKDTSLEINKEKK